MSSKKFTELLDDVLPTIKEIFPWDVAQFMTANPDTLILDVREANEFAQVKIKNSLHVPRGLLEMACEWGYDDTQPQLAAARERNIIVVCRSGNRSAFAAHTLQLLGFTKVQSLKTGLRGWNDSELELVDGSDTVIEADDADQFFISKPSPEQLGPQ